MGVRRSYKERVKESEYGGNITYLLMYENGKMKPVEATQE
jgi:hypothetical protein